MTKLAFPSVHREIVALALQSANFMKARKSTNRKKTSDLRAEAIRRTKDEWILATSDDSVLDAAIDNIKFYARNGDKDMLTAYAKFSVIKYPCLPFAVKTLRLVLGEYNVSDVITQAHIDIHHETSLLYMEVCGNVEGLEAERDWERELNNLQAFIFKNFDRADDIFAFMKSRRMTNIHDITEIMKEQEAVPALGDGIL